MADDTDSDWDSSVLDFSTTPRGPRTIGFNQHPPKEMDAIAETSEISNGESGFPTTNLKQNSTGNKQQHQDGTSVSKTHQRDGSLQRKDSLSRGKVLKGTTSQSRQEQSPNPPYNFRGMYESDIPEVEKPFKMPGRERKGNQYDPPYSQHDEMNSPSEEDDADEIILRQVRKNFNKERQKLTSKISKASHEHTNGSKLKGADSEMAKVKSSRPDLASVNSLKTNKEKSFSAYDKQKSSPVSGGSIVVGDINNQVNLDVPFKGAVISHVITDGVKEGIRYFYHFNQVDMNHYRVDDVTSSLVMPGIATKVEKVATRGIQEVFGCLKIVVVCIVVFISELLKFVCRDLIGPLLLRTMTTIGDHLLKPTFSGMYNCVIHPIFVLLWNIFSGLRHGLGPCLDITREVAGQIAMILKGFRLVEINQVSGIPSSVSQASVSGVEVV